MLSHVRQAAARVLALHHKLRHEAHVDQPNSLAHGAVLVLPERPPLVPPKRQPAQVLRRRLMYFRINRTATTSEIRCRSKSLWHRQVAGTAEQGAAAHTAAAAEGRGAGAGTQHSSTGTYRAAQAQGTQGTAHGQGQVAQQGTSPGGAYQSAPSQPETSRKLAPAASSRGCTAER